MRCIALLALLCGCSTYTISVEQGYGTQLSIAKAINTSPRYDDRSITGHYTSIKVGIEEKIGPGLKVNPRAGPALFVPNTTGNSDLYTFEVATRLSVRVESWRPYLEAGAGIGRPSHQWEGEGTKLLFTASGTVGSRIEVLENLELNLGYRFYHISNGSRIFGTDPPNVGYNTDVFLFSIQGKF